MKLFYPIELSLTKFRVTTDENLNNEKRHRAKRMEGPREETQKIKKDEENFTLQKPTKNV